MRILISADYLIASAFCPQEHITHYFLGLSTLKKEFESGKPVYVEHDAIAKLSDRGLYPSLDLFKKNLPYSLNAVVGADDITKLVNFFLHRVTRLNVQDDLLADWSDIEVDAYPDFHSDPERDTQISQIMVDLSLLNAAQGHSHIFLHHHTAGIPRQAKITGTISEVEPTHFAVPKPISHEVKISDTLLDFILSTDPLELFKSSQNDFDMKRALYFGAVQFITSLGEDHTSIQEQSFCIGCDFRQSAIQNECTGNGAYTSTLFEAIVRIITRRPKNDVNEFYTASGSGKQREKLGKLAWRTHLTEKGRALRLMFWTDSSGAIELANVGNKKDCVIL
jgi:hypothetical protein